MNEPKLRFKADDGSQFPDWEEKKFYEVIKLYRGSSPRPIVEYIVDGNQGLNWIKISDVPQNGNVIVTVKEHISKEGAKKSRAVYKGEIILSNSMSFGKPCILGIDGFIHDGWFVVREYEKYLNKWYLCQLLDSNIMYKQYRRLAAGGVVLNISSEIVNSTKIPVPSLPEQQKIAEFLSTIDTVIAKQKETVSAWEERKKGVMQKLFSQEVRFKADDGSDFPEWEEKKLGEYLIQYTEKTTENNQYPVLTSSRKGIYLQDDYYGRQVASENNIGYNIVPYGYFTYRHMSDDLIFRFNINNIVEKGIVSTLYPVFTVTDKIDSNFLQSYLNESTDFFKYCMLQKQGGSRTYMYFGKLKDFVAHFPCFAEQQKIADCLSSLDEVIEKQKATLAAWEALKKGLLQQMFV